MRLTSRRRQTPSTWRRSGPDSERSGPTAARTSRSTVNWWSGWLSRCSRTGRSCGGSARRPCRRPSRPAATGPATATRATAAPTVSVPRSIGMFGRPERVEHVVLRAEDRARNGEHDRHGHADGPGAEALAAAVEARHAPAHVSAAVVGDREHRDEQNAADEADRLGVRLRLCVAHLGQPERRPGRAQQPEQDRGHADRDQPAEERRAPVEPAVLGALACPHVTHALARRSVRAVRQSVTLVVTGRTVPRSPLSATPSPSVSCRVAVATLP